MEKKRILDGRQNEISWYVTPEDPELKKPRPLGRRKQFSNRVDEDLFLAFKVTAQLRGLKVEDALHEALFNWVKDQSKVFGEPLVVPLREVPLTLKREIREKEIRDLIKEWSDAKTRKASVGYQLIVEKELKRKVESYPLPKDVAETVRRILGLKITQGKEVENQT